jgi:hypothetical protein
MAELGVRTDNYQTPLAVAGSNPDYSSSLALSGPKTFTLGDGTKVSVGQIGQSQTQAASNTGYTPGIGYAAAPETQQGSTQGKGGSDMIGGVFSDVSAVYNDLRQNQASVQATQNSIFNRNLNRKNLALNEANMASNLATAGQNREQAGITFGQNQADRAGQLKMAAAASQGIAKGLLTMQSIPKS